VTPFKRAFAAAASRALVEISLAERRAPGRFFARTIAILPLPVPTRFNWV